MTKTKVGLLPIEEDAARIRAIRAGVGPDIKIMVDANHAYNVATACRMAKLLEPLDIVFFEEPVPPEDLKGYVEKRRLCVLYCVLYCVLCGVWCGVYYACCGRVLIQVFPLLLPQVRQAPPVYIDPYRRGGMRLYSLRL